MLDVVDKSSKEDEEDESVSDQQSNRGSAAADGGDEAERKHSRAKHGTQARKVASGIEDKTRGSAVRGSSDNKGADGKTESSRLSSASGGFMGKQLKVKGPGCCHMCCTRPSMPTCYVH